MRARADANSTKSCLRDGEGEEIRSGDRGIR